MIWQLLEPELDIYNNFLEGLIYIVVDFRLYKTDKEKYQELAKEWTRKYAM